MSIPGESTALERKLQELSEQRQSEERRYAELLTALDRNSYFDLPHEMPARFSELKETLNRAWDIEPAAYSAANSESRVFWNEVARNVVTYLKPVVQQQREFNGLVVHFLNEFVSCVTADLQQIRDFHHTLIQLFQRIIPVMDTRNREFRGSDQLYLQEVKNYADVIAQQMDKKIETIRAELNSLDALSTSVRSLQHFANAWKSAVRPAADGKASDGHGESHLDASYFHFQEDLRGDRNEIKDKFSKYVSYFQKAPEGLVLDLGCGRGEFLELMKEAGIPARGVDIDPNMVQKCRELQLEVVQNDLLSFLQGYPENSISGIFSAQVVEHLTPAYLNSFIHTAFTRLKHDGVIILETVNVGSAFGFLHVFTKDLSHTTPLHPDTLRFLTASAGFHNPELLPNSPVPLIDKLMLLKDATTEEHVVFNSNMEKLNHLLYADLEYAIFATK